jgi:hypothetical protein
MGFTIMNKLPKLPFEIIVLILEYAIKPTTYQPYRNREIKPIYYIKCKDSGYGYGSIYALTSFIYKEIYQSLP